MRKRFTLMVKIFEPLNHIYVLHMRMGGCKNFSRRGHNIVIVGTKKKKKKFLKTHVFYNLVHKSTSLFFVYCFDYHTFPVEKYSSFFVYLYFILFLFFFLTENWNAAAKYINLTQLLTSYINYSSSSI